MHQIDIETEILKDNKARALDNRALFNQHKLYVLNLMSGPGAGKTTLLERTIQELKDSYRLGAIVGDIQGDDDTRRLARHGIPATQINTKGACHLTSPEITHALSHLDLDNLDVLLIENVGNLVCPAEFDLGEHDKIMILSVTEGHDKPAKYPIMFHQARVLLINKIDLLEHTDFDQAKAIKAVRNLNLDISIFPVSCKTGAGLEEWFGWLKNRIAAVKALSAEE